LLPEEAKYPVNPKPVIYCGRNASAYHQKTLKIYQTTFLGVRFVCSLFVYYKADNAVVALNKHISSF